MHLSATELTIIGDLSGGRFHQRRTAERRHAIFFHADDVIRHARHVGATRRGTAVQHNHRRQTHR